MGLPVEFAGRRHGRRDGRVYRIAYIPSQNHAK